MKYRDLIKLDSSRAILYFCALARLDINITSGTRVFVVRNIINQLMAITIHY